MKHSKLAEGIEQAITEEKKFIPAGVDAESVKSVLRMYLQEDIYVYACHVTE